MAEPTNTDPIPLEVIDEDTIVEIKVNYHFYNRIKNIMFEALPFKDLEHMTAVVKQIKTEDYTSDPLAEHLFTLLVIANDFEEGAKKQGKVKMKKFDPITQKVID